MRLWLIWFSCAMFTIGFTANPKEFDLPIFLTYLVFWPIMLGSKLAELIF